MPSKSVMVVEDEPIAAAEFRSMLSNSGYRVTAVTASGEEACLLAGKYRPDLVLMDVTLAGKMDGIEAAASIRKAFGIPSVFLTLDPSRPTFEKAKTHAMAYGYLVKPCKVEDLCNAVELALSRDRIERGVDDSREEFVALAEKNLDGIVVSRPDGTVCYANPVARNIRGNCAGDAWAGIVRELAEGAIKTKTFVGGDGERYEVEMKGQSTTWEGEAANLVFLRDITGVVRAGEKLRQQAVLLRSRVDELDRLYESMIDGVIITDFDGKIVQANGAVAQILGESSADATIGSSWIDHVSQRYGPHLRAIHEEVFRKGSSRNWEMAVIGKDREEVPVMGNTTLLKDAAGRLLGTISVIRDITELKGAEQKIRAQADILRDRIREMGCLYQSSKLLARQGISVEEALQGIADLIPMGYQYPEIACARVVFQGRQFESSGFRETPWAQAARIMASGAEAGTLHVCYREGRPSRDEGPFSIEERELLNALAREIGGFLDRKRATIAEKDLRKSLEEANRELRKLANIDHLTGVLNRRGMEAALHLETDRMKTNRTMMFGLFLDCDDFKRINDRFGHETGDGFLVELARQVRNMLRPYDHVGRIGGDEFVVFLPNIAFSDSVRVAERVRMAIGSTRVMSPPEDVRVTVSIGIFQIGEGTSSIEELIPAGRIAMNKSKKQGKNRVASQIEDTSSGNAVEAVEKLARKESIYVVSQRIVSLYDERTVGHEFLARSTIPNYESPDDFFRLSIDSNILFIVDIHCLKQCIHKAAQLESRGRIHINVFPTTIMNISPDRFLEIFPADRPAGRFCLELSERQLLGNPDPLVERVKEIRRAGILVAMDDIGFGHTSLEMLVRLEPDVAKLDRALISGAAGDRDKRRVLEHVTKFLSQMNLEIVAEGVETREEFELLRELGVPYAQGYLWGKPG